MRLLFCSPLLINSEEQDRVTAYKNFSSATDLYYPISLQDGSKATLLIPGWIRERTVEVLFEGDEDEPGLAHCILNGLTKVCVVVLFVEGLKVTAILRVLGPTRFT